MMTLKGVEQLETCSIHEVVLILMPDKTPMLFQRERSSHTPALCWLTPGYDREMHSADIEMFVQLEGIKDPEFMLILSYRDE